VFKSAIAIPLINSATSMLAAVVLFTFLGHISKQLGIDINDIPIDGIELAFVAYPALLT
jgi:SNF family Na+-dependent transporter